MTHVNHLTHPWLSECSHRAVCEDARAARVSGTALLVLKRGKSSGTSIRHELVCVRERNKYTFVKGLV